MDLSHVLIGPIVSEKAYRLQDAGQYTVRIHPAATKITVQNAFRHYFGVEALSVRVSGIREKSRMVGKGKRLTKREAARKALITVEKGIKIDFGKLIVHKK